ncbi:MAG: hypothetical protein ACRDTG_03105, partial [Pseudonocardiaceae bacterium]
MNITPSRSDHITRHRAQRHRAQRRPITRAALVLSMVDTCTGTLHRVPIETAALHRRSGRYPALCGIEVAAASLTTLAADDCWDCAARVQQTTAAPDRKPRRPLLR